MSITKVEIFNSSDDALIKSVDNPPIVQYNGKDTIQPQLDNVASGTLSIYYKVYKDSVLDFTSEVFSYTVNDEIIIQEDLAFDANTFTFSAADYNASTNASGYNINHPKMVFKNGKTVHAAVQTDNHKMVIFEMTPNGLRPPHISKGTQDTYNYHDIPVVHFEGNRFNLVQENNHNVNPMMYHKAKADNDTLILSDNFGQVGASSPNTYPNLYSKEGNLITVGQIGDNEAGITINTEGTLAGTWNENINILTRDTDENERYQMGINNKKFSTDIIFVSVGRNSTANPSAPNIIRGNIFRARKGVGNTFNYYRYDGQLIVENSSTGMSASEARVAEYFDTGDPNAQAYFPLVGIDQAEIFYSVQKSNTVDYTLTIWKPNDAAPTNTIIDFPDNPNLVEGSPTQNHAGLFLYPVDINNIQLFMKVNNGTRIIARNYKTVDQGATWTFVQDIDFGADVKGMGLANNYLDIPDNTNTAIFANSTAGDYLIKKVAFGAIQSEPNVYDNLTPILESAFNSTALASYFVESGKITNSGTTINSLIDQSANGNNLTLNGSPVIDNETTPTKMIFDGSDDYASLDPALLQSGQSVLILEVIDAKGGAATPISITNNSNGNSFIFPQLRESDNVIRTASKYNSATTEIIAGDSDITPGFHICAWLFRGGQHSNLMWYDGKMQLRNATDAQYEEGSYILPNTNTHLELGRAVFNSTIYQSFDMKHISIHDVTSESQILDRIKFLGDKYGITLQNAYR